LGWKGWAGPDRVKCDVQARALLAFTTGDVLGNALMLLGLCLLAVALVALARGRVRGAPTRSNRTAVAAAIAGVAVLGVGGVLSGQHRSGAAADQESSGTSSAPSAAARTTGPGSTATAARSSPPAQGTPATDAAAVADARTWDALAHCESGGNWASNTGNGLYGGLQLDRAVWLRNGGAAYAPLPKNATREQQIIVARKVRKDRGGYSAWSSCATRLGLH